MKKPIHAQIVLLMLVAFVLTCSCVITGSGSGNGGGSGSEREENTGNTGNEENAETDSGYQENSAQGRDVYIAVIDGDSHGDTVVSILAEHAPDAIIMPMYPADNLPTVGDSIREAVDDGADIINLSSRWTLDYEEVRLPCESARMDPDLGGNNEELRDDILFVRNIQEDVEKSVKYALRHDVLIFAAIDYGTATPACIDGVIGVGAAGQADSTYVDFLAREANSSWATPVVAAAAARLMAQHPNYSPAQVVDALPPVVE